MTEITPLIRAACLAGACVTLAGIVSGQRPIEQLGTSVKFAVSEGKQYCEVLKLPAPWSSQDPKKEWASAHIQYRWPSGNRDAILATPGLLDAANRPMASAGYTEEGAKYKINLSTPTHISLASEDDWKSGTAVPLWPSLEDTLRERSAEVLVPDRMPDVDEGHRDPSEFHYEGHTFEKSGRIWYDLPVLLSPKRGFAALQSLDGWSSGGRFPFPENCTSTFTIWPPDVLSPGLLEVGRTGP